MRAIRSLQSWLRSLVRRERVEQEIDAELQFHLEQEAAERVAAGQSAAEAREAALRALGSVAYAKDGCRDSLGLRVADRLRQDVRHTTRMIVREPGFALVVILSLALGIGGNTAIFQLINSVRLRTLPVPHPEEIVSVQVAGGQRLRARSQPARHPLGHRLLQRQPLTVGGPGDRARRPPLCVGQNAAATRRI